MPARAFPWRKSGRARTNPDPQTWKAYSGCRATADSGYGSSIGHCPFLRARWERRGARGCAQTRSDRDRIWPHDLPGRLLPGSSFPRALCCGPGCHELSQERSQRSSMPPSTCRNQGPGFVHRLWLFKSADPARYPLASALFMFSARPHQDHQTENAPMVCTSSARAYAPAVTDDHMLPGERVRVRVNLVRWAQVIPANALAFGAASNRSAVPSGRVRRRGAVECRAHHGTGAAGRILHVGQRLGRLRTGPDTHCAVRADANGDKLEHNLEPLRGQHPSEADLRSAYQRFNSASPTHLRGLGPAFFSKVLYFAGYRRGAGGVQPLILDGRVARHLPPAAGAARGRRWGLAKRAVDCLPEMGSRPGHPDRVRRGTRRGRDGLVQRRMGAR